MKTIFLLATLLLVSACENPINQSVEKYEARLVEARMTKPSGRLYLVFPGGIKNSDGSIDTCSLSLTMSDEKMFVRYNTPDIRMADDGLGDFVGNAFIFALEKTLGIYQVQSQTEYSAYMDNNGDRQLQETTVSPELTVMSKTQVRLKFPYKQKEPQEIMLTVDADNTPKAVSFKGRECELLPELSRIFHTYREG